MSRTTLAWLAGLPALLVAAAIALLAVPFWLVANLTRFVGRRLASGTVTWEEVVEFDAELGWRLRRNVDERLEEEPFHVVTDSAGFRGSCSLKESDVVVIGDSFAFGHRADERDFFAEHGGDVRIKAVAAPGYSMVQGLLWMERLVPRLRGKVVVWMVYLGNDLEDNLRPHMSGYRAPFARSGPTRGCWMIEQGHISPERWRIVSRRPNYEGFVEICCSTYLTERVFSACEYLIRRGNETCQRAGARLVVLTVPDLSPQVLRQHASVLAKRSDARRFDPDLPDRKLREICTQLGIRFLALKDHLDAGHYLPDDCHWTVGGHRRVAEILRDLYRNHGPRARPARPLRTEGVQKLAVSAEG